MKRIFNQLKFNREFATRDTITKSEYQFYVPGVNSGIYDPATLVISARIEEQKAGFFKFGTVVSFDRIILTPSEFDELFSEMEKIKNLRDSLKNPNNY